MHSYVTNIFPLCFFRKSSGRPLISIFTTLDNKCSSTSTTNLMQSQHSSSNAKLLTIDDDSLR